MEPAVGMQWQFEQADQWPESAASRAKHLNRATVLGDLHSTNTDRPSFPAPGAIPMNTAVDLFAAAYREPAPVAAPIRWANSVASIADPLPMTLLANTALSPIAAEASVPLNEVMEPQDTG